MPFFVDQKDTLRSKSTDKRGRSTHNKQNMVEIIWTEYLKYRAKLRGFDLAKIEDIIRYTTIGVRTEWH